MEGSQDEVMRYLRLTEAEFQIPGERTSAAKSQDWAVNRAWGGSAALAESGMMNIFRTQGDRQVGTGTYDAAVVICQHGDGSCDVRLLNDLALIVRRVHVQLSNITLYVDARARVRA